MENIFETKSNRLIGTNRSYEKYFQQSPKIRNNKYRPLSSKPNLLTFVDTNIYNNDFIIKGTNLPKQMKRLSNEELIKIIGPTNKKAGNVNKNKKKILKNFLGDKKIKIKTDINNEENTKENTNNNNIRQINKFKKLKLDINESNSVKNEILNKKKNNIFKTKREKDKYLPKGYLQYENYLLNNNNMKKERIYNTKELKQKSYESDIFFFRPKTEKEAQKITHKEKARNYNIKLGSDIFNSKSDLINLMKSGELYLFRKNRNPFSTESNSFWSSKVSTQTYMNYPSVEYNILNPSIKNNTKTRTKIYKESLDNNQMNPIYRQKSIGTFYDITKVGMNRNKTYQKLYEENKKVFCRSDNVCTSQYDTYQNYKGLVPKPFLTQVNKHVYI